MKVQQELMRHASILTGASEPSELIYFKLFKNQLPVIEQALETAARLLGSDRSRGYCLEMICADFLAGANLENDNPEMLLMSEIQETRCLFCPSTVRYIIDFSVSIASPDKKRPEGLGSPQPRGTAECRRA